MAHTPAQYVSRGGIKLAGALDAFGVDVEGRVCADLGSNQGGFVDCLLQRGAAKVYAVDTGYGVLAWPLRQDQRVVVMERTNALYWGTDGANQRANSEQAASVAGSCGLVTIDLGWTRQTHAIPAALRWLKPSENACIITLIKPHYEADKQTMNKFAHRGVLEESAAQDVAQRVLSQIGTLGMRVVDSIQSPIRGGGGKGKVGNVEYLALLVHDA